MQNLRASLSGEQRRGDIRGGLQAAALSLPLALAFGILSGAGPIAGFYGAICVGFLAAMVGGTQAQISGPTGPTALVLAAVIASFPGAPEKVFTVVMLAGFAQMLFGALGLGKYAYLLPYPVISGWASGIGTVIIIMQLAPLLGLPPMSHPTQALMHLSGDLQHFNADALALGLLSLALTYSVPARFKHLLPPHLLALLLGTLAGGLVFTNAPTLGPIESILPTLQAFSVSQADMNTMLFAALSIALLGSIDSLLASMTAVFMPGVQQSRTRPASGRVGLGRSGSAGRARPASDITRSVGDDLDAGDGRPRRCEPGRGTCRRARSPPRPQRVRTDGTGARGRFWATHTGRLSLTLCRLGRRGA